MAVLRKKTGELYCVAQVHGVHQQIPLFRAPRLIHVNRAVRARAYGWG
jgi:hypothetical protein